MSRSQAKQSLAHLSCTGRPIERPVSDRREQIYQTAAQLFSEVGYHATSMRDIASALNIKAGSLYAHIASKEELLWEIVCRMADEFDAALRPIETGTSTAGQPSAAEQLTTALEAYVGVVTCNLGFAQVLFSEWRHLPAQRQAFIIKRRSAVEQLFRDILGGGVASGEFKPELDVRLTAVLALSGANWLPQWYKVSGPLSPAEVADQFVALLLGGIRKE